MTRPIRFVEKNDFGAAFIVDTRAAAFARLCLTVPARLTSKIRSSGSVV